MESKMQPNSGQNYSGQNYTDMIGKLNHQRMLFQLPVILVLSLIMTVSLLGNTMVVCVYKSKYKKRTSNYFILVLAVVDLCSSLCVPFVVFDLANPYMFPVPAACKINRFLEAFTCTASGFVLLCIAFDRFFHVCYPLRIYSQKQARAFTTVMMTMAACLTWPMLFLAGKRTVPTRIPGLFGEDCSYSDAMHHSVYALLFLAQLFLTFSITYCIAIVFYASIFYTVCKRKYKKIGEEVPRVKADTSFSESSQTRVCQSLNTSVSIIELPRTPDQDTNGAATKGNMQKTNGSDSDGVNISKVTDSSLSVLTSSSDPVLRKTKRNFSNIQNVMASPGKAIKRRAGTSQIRTTRTTMILAVVTLSTLVGFLPYLAVTMLITFGKKFQHGMSSSEDLAYEFCSKSYFLNAAVNPVIYSVMNPVFRRESIALLKWFPGQCQRK